MLDREGYRPNVGIVLCNAKNEVFWGKRIREHSWQFPQGGIKRGENHGAGFAFNPRRSRTSARGSIDAYTLAMIQTALL